MSPRPAMSHGQGNAIKAQLAREARETIVVGMAVGMSEGSVHLFHGPDEPCTIGVCQAPWHHGSRTVRTYIMGTITENLPAELDGNGDFVVTYECCDPCITHHTLTILAPDRYRKQRHEHPG